MHDMFQSAGLVAYWRPVDGVRHGLLPTEPPYPGQERETLCGTTVSIVKPTDLDWLAPTCGPCWDEARSRRDAAEVANEAGAQ
ncbi:zinc-finger [Saccharopolyspora antimicrobica]|uniref:Zinc finger protein n=1 Tax=Saccharopolyspora antimicrobica TaxID=455193 RepID=A0A1I5G321_9PSEU|nr:zinc finger protein [Saccharopolyspora antimicrobica]RKT83949.1 zinc finger protein [Saccharopolyspora antimicrobica]SFO30398.1 zinc-finger [Saccharopolyspora antimicrobica]